MRSTAKALMLAAMLGLGTVEADAPPPTQPVRRRVDCNRCGGFGLVDLPAEIRVEEGRIVGGGAVTCPRCGSTDTVVGSPILEGSEAPTPMTENEPEALSQIRERFGQRAAVIALCVARALPEGGEFDISDDGAISFRFPEDLGWVDPWTEDGDALSLVALSNIPHLPATIADSVVRTLRARNGGVESAQEVDSQ